jgi:hypothetical protein
MALFTWILHLKTSFGFLFGLYPDFAREQQKIPNLTQSYPTKPKAGKNQALENT